VKYLLIFSIVVLCAGCELPDATTGKNDASPAYVVVKNGADHLITVHGFADNLSACLMLIEPYNADPSLSVLPGAYACVQAQ
jgi:hypothetical protein